MKDEDLDEILTLAFANLRRSEPPAAFQKAVANQPRAQLATLIEAFIEEHPHIASRALLQKVADLNQGTPEDLDRMDFQSYLIGRFGASEAELRQCRHALGTYRRLVQSASGEQVQMAARDEAGKGGGTATVSEIRAVFKKRKK